MNMSIPEVLETEVGESIGARTASLPTFKELGPPDLVHITKQIPKTKENGTYHYVTGVDASSSASVAAYVNTLTFSLGEQQLWFGKTPGWKVISGVYCTFNAFSRVDVRVTAMIPGTVQTMFIDEQGKKQETELTDDQWDETFVSAMLRSLLYCDDDVYYVSCCRRLNPLTRESSKLFLEAFERLFPQGPSLGSVSEVQMPTVTQNYLVDGFLRFVQVSGMYDQAVEVLDRLLETEPEVAVLKVQVLLAQHKEVEGVKAMSQGIEANPRDADLLELQADFCKTKKRLDLALDCAIRAINSSPSEFMPWQMLVQVYTARGEYEQALLTLNSCPMFTYHDLDTHRMPPPNRVHLPLPVDGVLDEVWAAPTQDTEQDNADPDLLKLPAPTLRATFAKAYNLLTELVSHVGWDELLRTRSRVFVMEEEYRKERRKNSTPTINGSAVSEAVTNDTNLSTNAILGKPSEAASEASAANTDEPPPKLDTSPAPATTAGLTPGKQQNGIIGELKNKRLCERWLDNLFMVLYEDLRVYTVWRSNYIQAQSQQAPYEKSALEWEILGMVAYRLKHKEEAIDAFNHSLKLKFSHRVLWKIVEYQMGPKNNGVPELDVVVRLIAWNHRWYCEFSPKLMASLRAIVAREGLTKVQNSVSAKYSGQGIVQLMEQNYKTLKLFNAEGTDS